MFNISNTSEDNVNFGITLPIGNTISEGYIAHLVSVLKKSGIYTLKVGGNFWSWYQQFPCRNYVNLNQSEYITLLNNFLDLDVQEALQKIGISPREIGATAFLREVQRIVNKNIITTDEIEAQLSKLSPKKSNAPLEYLLDIFSLTDIIHDSEWNELQKRSLILNTFCRVFSGPFQLFIMKHSRKIAPGIANYKEGLRSFVRSYHKILSQDMSKNTNLRQVKEISLDVDITEQINQNNMKGQNKASNEKPKQVKQTNNQGQKEKKVILPRVSDIHCKQCFKVGHKSSRCIYNEDRKVADENQRRLGFAYCLLCSGTDHMALNCNIFPNVRATKYDCYICDSNGLYNRKHPADKCNLTPKN